MAGLLPHDGLPEGKGLLVGGWLHDLDNIEHLKYAGDLHQLIVAGTGGGKFTTALATMLFGSGLEKSTVVAVDPKGEMAQLLGPYFETPFGDEQTVHILDPWNECKTGRTASLNVLEQINLDNPNYVDDARALADAMVIPSGGDNTHWDNTAKNFLTAMILYVALSPNEKQRDLLRLRELIAMPWESPKVSRGKKVPSLTEVLIDLLDSDLAGGAVKRGVASLLNRVDKERSGIISSIERDTAWIDSPQIEKVLKASTFSLEDAALKGHKYFVVLPAQFFSTHRAWLRLTVTAFATAFKRYRPGRDVHGEARWRHIIIDEFANLGEMKFVQDDIAVARGFDVKYHLAVQDLSQLARAYRHSWESFINNTFQRFFAVSDMFTAEYVSRMLGTSTVESVSQSSSYSESYGSSFSMNDGRSSSTNAGTMGGGSSTRGSNYGTSEGMNESVGWSKGQSVSQIGRPLKTPDEVRRMSKATGLLFVRGQFPIQYYRFPYYHRWTGLPDFSLKDVFETIGRRPSNEGERARFMAWRDRFAIRERPAEFKQKEEFRLPEIETPHWLVVLFTDWRYRLLCWLDRVTAFIKPLLVRVFGRLKPWLPQIGLGVAGAFLLYLYLPQVLNRLMPARSSPPSPQLVETTAQPAPASKPSFKIVPPPSLPTPAAASAPERQASLVAATPAPPGVTQPTETLTAPAASAPTSPSQDRRPALPTAAAIKAAPRGNVTRDRLIAALKEQLKFCEPSRAAQEGQVIKTLFFAARDAAYGNSLAKNSKQYFDRYFDWNLQPNWQPSQYRAILDLMIDGLQKSDPHDIMLGTIATRAFDTFYANNQCPFGQVSRTAYQAASFTEASLR